MFWQEAMHTLYLLLADGRWLASPDQWQEGMPDYTCQLQAPAGLQQPVRGFGLLWCREQAIREALGWARTPERGLQALHQPFERGILLRDDGGLIWALHSTGSWQVFGP